VYIINLLHFTQGCVYNIGVHLYATTDTSIAPFLLIIYTSYFIPAVG